MAATQLGTTLKIGFGNLTYTGYIPEDGFSWSKPYGNQEDITDAVGDMETKILMDARDEFTGSFIILDATGSTTPPAQGATVTITNPANTSVACMCQSANVTFNRGHAVLTMTLVKEGSMTYS